MKFSGGYLLALSLGVALIAAPAQATNLDFEAGNLSGWTVNTTFADANTSYGGFSPVHGTYLGRIDAGLGTDVYSTLSQTIALNAGDTLTGYAGFATPDYLPYNDDAYLKVGDRTLLSWSVASVGDRSKSDWQKFTFQAATAGNYLLQLGVANHGDNGLSSTAVLDNISITPGAVPEPAGWTMLVGGFGLIGGALRANRRKLRLA